MGRLGDGRVVFVKGAWAGEQVKAKMTVEKKNFVKADLVEVVEPSPDRIAPGAEGNVPGCVYAAIDYRAERSAKESQLREALERARLIEPGFPVSCGSGKDGFRTLNYRNKAVYHFAKSRGVWAIGYRREPQHDIVDIVNDPLAVDEINAKLPEMRKSVTALLTAGPAAVRRDVERSGGVTVRWSRKSGVRWWVGEPPKDLVFKEITSGVAFEVPAGGFYQMNPRVGGALVDYVVAEYAKNPGDLVDLYCGVGVFGLCCAVKTQAAAKRRIYGVESGHQAVEFARRNAAALGVEARFTAGQVVRNLKALKTAGATVVADPPRGGMEKGVPEFLACSGADKIVYVSCDPATLARDLKILSPSYRVSDVAWFDMFPRTARFESVVTLVKT